MIAVESVTKRFGDFTALDDVSLEVARRLADRAARAQRLGQVDAAARDRRARGARRAATVVVGGSDATRLPPQKRGIGFVFQHYAAFKHMTRARQRRVRAEDPQAAEGRDQGQGRRAARTSSGSTASTTATRRSSPAASASAWRSPARWRSSRACCCSTSRSARSTPTCARTCAPGCGACTSEVHVTTVLVTHDQEEAMEVADRIVLLKDGRIEQVGAPRELYEQPANAFVMGFLGPVVDGRRRARAPARPRALRPSRRTAAEEAMVAARRAPRLRGPRRARARRRRGGHGAAHARARPRSSSSTPATIVWVRAAGRAASAPDPAPPGRRPRRSISGGSSPAARSASVTCSTTARRLRAHGDPDSLQVLGGARVVDVLGRLAADAGQRALDGADDVGERDLLGRLGEPVAALGAALAAHEPRVAQVGEDVLEELRAGCPGRWRARRP